MSESRLHWGCGYVTPPGWIHCDKEPFPGVDMVCDIRQGLPLPDGRMDYVVSMHALPEIPPNELEDVLWELRRVLKPGGVLRLGLPDMLRAVDAYLRGDAAYFLVADDTCASLGGKLVTQLTWFGRSRSLFTSDSVLELLQRSGFRSACTCGFRRTASRFPEIVALDNREPESLFVEGTR